jgi:hypothetical protein
MEGLCLEPPKLSRSHADGLVTQSCPLLLLFFLALGDPVASWLSFESRSSVYMVGNLPQSLRGQWN